MKRKVCTKCSKRRVISRFYLNAASPDGLGPWCKPCMDNRRKDNKEKNPDRERAYARKLYRQPGQQQKKREYNKSHRAQQRKNEKRYRTRHPERYRDNQRASAEKARANDLEKFLANRRSGTARYRKRHPDRVRDHQANAQARRRKAHMVERVYRKEVHTRDNGRCYLCSDPITFEEMHLDHVIPLSRGGEHSYANVKAACARCNLVKGSKLLSEL